MARRSIRLRGLRYMNRCADHVPRFRGAAPVFDYKPRAVGMGLRAEIATSRRNRHKLNP